MNLSQAFFSLALGVLFLIVPEHARAEGRCPDGFIPIGGGNAGWEGCAPIGGGEEEPVEPHWETRWGAVAVTGGAYGYSTSFATKRAAEKEALSQCKRNSNGGKCKVRQAYYDQCIALAWGANGNITNTAEKVGQAENLAMQACGQYSQDCRIYYSGCSYPEHVD